MLTKTSRFLAARAVFVNRLLNFAAHGISPRRYRIIFAYLRLLVLRQIYIFLGLRLTSFEFLNFKIEFFDVDVFKYLLLEVFLEESYRFPYDTRPKTIIDCGSNIGISVLFFKNLFPEAIITAIEAFPPTFCLLERNVQANHLSNVRTFNKALAGERGSICFFSEPGSVLGSSNAIRGEGQYVMVDSVPLSDFVTGDVDLLKIDIEGSETAVFQELEESGKLSYIGIMLIEYHHHLPSESSLLSPFLERLERCGFDYEISAATPDRTGGYQDIFIRAHRRSRPHFEQFAASTERARMAGAFKER